MDHSEVMEKKLYDACLEGDVEALEALIKEDKLTLSRVSISSSFNQTPLHLACMLGHFEFAKSLLSYKPDFASSLDLQGRSALHLASANGYANIVELLLKYDPKMCQVSDEDERTPLHLAVMKGQHECVRELLKVNSESSNQERKILDWCVNYNCLNVLILMLDSNDQDLSNIKNENGDTIFHSATTLKRIQIIKYLVKCRSEVDVNVKNGKSLTALDIIEEMPQDAKTREIKEFLTKEGALRTPGKMQSMRRLGKMQSMWNKVKNMPIFDEVKEKDETLLIGATVIAAMAYAAAISPPGGVAGMDATSYQQDDVYHVSYRLEPGSSLLGYFYYRISNKFWRFNTISFMASLSVIFIYVSGASLKKKFFIWLIRAAMWLTLSAMTVAYIAAVQATTPRYSTNKNTNDALKLALRIWILLMAISCLVVAFRIGLYIVRAFGKRAIEKKRAMMKKSTSEVATAPDTTPDAHHVVIK